ncbi:MAG: hypothetical protein IJJ63_03340 [Bacilli bacterium]|nr:hypothetical protein [Bacilli bacterium]
MKEKKILKVLEVVELILTMIAIILLTLLFRFEVTNLRFIFLFMNFYLIYSFSKILFNFEKRIQIEKKTMPRKDFEVSY